MNFLDPAFSDYLKTIGPKLSPAQQVLLEQTRKMPEHKMLTTSDQAALLSFLVGLLQPKHILEIGVYTGFSALTMAEGCEHSKITAIDRNPEWTKIAKKHWQLAGVDDRIQLMLGDAADILDELHENNHLFDFIFIDADKKNYDYYFEASLNLMAEKGVMILDNITGRGLTFSADTENPNRSALRKLNEKLSTDARIHYCTLPLSDGMTFIRKRVSSR